MKKNDRYTSLLWTVVGFYIAFEGYRLKLGTLHYPGSGFIIFWAGLAISTLSLALLAFTFLSREAEEQKNLWKGRNWTNGIKVMVLLFIYVFVLKWAGFLLSTFLLLLFLLKSMGPQRWRVAFFIAGLAIASCYIIFGVLIDTQLPKGVLEMAIGWVYR
jgi:putative tricarboxylic transport membrane protein